MKIPQWKWLAAGLVAFMAILPLLPTTYWQWYWFNYRLMQKAASLLS